MTALLPTDRHQDARETKRLSGGSDKVPASRDVRRPSTEPPEHPPSLPRGGDSARGLLHAGNCRERRPPRLHQLARRPAGAGGSLRPSRSGCRRRSLPQQEHRAQRPQVREHHDHRRHENQDRR